MNSKNSLWISADEAAEMVGLSVSTFERYVICGELKGKVRKSKLTHKAKARYSRIDIEKLHEQKAVA